jgi:hypothetical protein
VGWAVAVANPRTRADVRVVARADIGAGVNTQDLRR